MARLALAAVLLLGSLALQAHSAEDPTQSLEGVVDLTPETWDKYVNGGKAVLVEFYAPWCGHCKHLVPEYKKLGKLVQEDPKLKNRVVIGKVDADNHRSLGEKFKVKGFPTIKFFPRGKAPSAETVKDYNMARTAEKFLEYIKEALSSDAGAARVEALDALAQAFVGAADKQAAIKELADAVAGLSGEDKEHGELYVKLAEKAAEKGAEYLGKEKARLDKMLASGSVAAGKVEELSRKSSVLGAFVASEE